jgi:hypothetical protein
MAQEPLSFGIRELSQLLKIRKHTKGPAVLQKLRRERDRREVSIPLALRQSIQTGDR